MQPTEKTDISVLIPVFNEEKNIGRCLEALKGWAGEIVVVDSQSTDNAVVIAESFDAKVLQFHYKGGWPKKRQWDLDTYDFQNVRQITRGPQNNMVRFLLVTSQKDY